MKIKVAFAISNIDLYPFAVFRFGAPARHN